MAKELITRTWCDAHLARGEQVPARTIAAVVLDGKPARDLDVCETCEKEIVEPLRALLDDVGQPSQTTVLSCPVCGKTYVKPTSLQSHIRRRHSSSLETVPPTPEGEFPCPQPGCGRTFTTAVGLGSHRARAHGYVSPQNPKGKAQEASA